MLGCYFGLCHAASSLLYNGYWVSFPGVKRSGLGVDHPLSSSAEVKERVELYLYSHSGPSWPVLGRTLPFTRLLRAKFFPVESTVTVLFEATGM